MRNRSGFIRTTVIGGVVFLVPLVIVLLALGKALAFASHLATPIANLFPEFSLLGLGAKTLIGIVLLILIAFGAGLLARTELGKMGRDWIEDTLLNAIPQYQMVKSMVEGYAAIENAEGLKPLLISIEGGWQIGYLLEEIQEGWVSVFVPQAPTPTSGNVMLLPSARVRELDMPIGEAMLLVKRLGFGASAALGKHDLRLPEGA